MPAAGMAKPHQSQEARIPPIFQVDNWDPKYLIHHVLPPWMHTDRTESEEEQPGPKPALQCGLEGSTHDITTNTAESNLFLSFS